jgi:hypothetical protein
MPKLKCTLIIMTMLITNSLYSRESKNVEVKKEEPKQEEVKPEESRQNESSKDESSKDESKKDQTNKDAKATSLPKQKECFYHVQSLANIENHKFDDEVKRIENTFIKCQQFLVKEKECKIMELELKNKKSQILKPINASSRISKKEDFDKLITEVKSAKEESTSLENKFKEKCQVAKKHESFTEAKKED